MEFLRFKTKALQEIQKSANKPTFTELYLAYDALQQKHPFYVCGDVQNDYNIITKGQFDLSRRIYTAKTIRVGDYRVTQKKYTRLVENFSTAICKIHTKCFTSTKRKANINFDVSFMKFESIFVVLWPFEIKNHFQNY